MLGFSKAVLCPPHHAYPLERGTRTRETLSVPTLLAAWPLLCHMDPSVISERLLEHPEQDFILLSLPWLVGLGTSTCWPCRSEPHSVTSSELPVFSELLPFTDDSTLI